MVKIISLKLCWSSKNFKQSQKFGWILKVSDMVRTLLYLNWRSDIGFYSHYVDYVHFLLIISKPLIHIHRFFTDSLQSFGKNPYTVSNKYVHLAVFEICVFRVYLRNHLRYKKVIYIYLHPCLKSFQIKNNFWNPVTKSVDIFKNAVLPEKSKLLEKIHHFYIVIVNPMLRNDYFMFFF